MNNNKVKTASQTVLLVSVLLLSALAGVPFVGQVSASGYTEYTGTLGGADFVARFPEPWNGMLVVFCRFYWPIPITAATALQYQSVAVSGLLSQGFAVAASGYNSTGLCIQKGMNNTYELTMHIIDTYHVTGKVFLWGVSMGGAIALLLGEKYPNVYSGVLDVVGMKDLKESYAIATNRTQYEVETGGTPTTKPKEYEDRSPTYHANITIPVITIHGTNDTTVPFYHSTMYQTAVASTGHSRLYRLYSVIGEGHMSAVIVGQVPSRFAELVAWSNALDAWTMTVDGRSMKAYPDLKETVWQKNATMPPNGEYDRIGLHRLVKTGITPKGVVFLTNCPMWGTGELRISNPATDDWTKYENFSQAIYWANRGFDVYAIDYRTHFVPRTLNGSQMSFAADWGLDVWVSDIKEAAEKVKLVSGSEKFFISGECTGGMAALNYATKYWRTDLKGIILLDPNFLSVGYPVVGRINETNTYNLTAQVDLMNTNRDYAVEAYATLRPVFAYALENPGAPAEYPPGTPLTPATNPATNSTWTNITEWATYGLRAFNLRGVSGNTSQVEYAVIKGEFLPTRFSLEANAMINWVNCSDLTYDYNDHYNEIGVPLLAFDSGLFSNRTGTLRFVNGINNTDFTAVVLPTYGHLDVYMGTDSVRDVSQPALIWMLTRMSTLRASAFCNVTVRAGWAWNFFVHSLGGVGTVSYQWYEGTTPLAGQTSMVLTVTKNSPGIYVYYCKVTDADGITINSNNITLTVLS